jgi:heptosyltransferase-3
LATGQDAASTADACRYQHVNSFGGKILVIRGGAIGDFILTLPAIAALRQQFPQAYLEVLGYPHIVQLAIAAGLVDRVRSIDARPLAAFFARNGTLAEEMRDYFSEFDLIVSYLYDPDEIFRANLARCSPAQFIAGPHRPDEHNLLHATKVYLKPLERLAIFDVDPVPKLPLAATKRPAASRTLLALHPGSGSEAKNWPEAKWAELLECMVNDTDYEFLLVGGEAEGARLQRLSAALPPSRTRVAQSLPLPELAMLLAQSNGFIGHDSGISHLAAAVGLTALLLWADSTQEIWQPLGENVVILREPSGLSRLPVSTVFQTFERLWSTGSGYEEARNQP